MIPQEGAEEQLLFNLIDVFRDLCRTEKRLTVSEWADEYRILSPEASAEIGKWNTNRAPYQRGLMDAFTDPRIETVVLKTSSQVGKSEVLLNLLGWIIHQSPGPTMVLQPTLDMAKTFSTDRIAPMVRDCPDLTPLVSDPKSKSGEATILHRSFKGGHYTLIGANAPAGLAGRPIKYLLADEIDRYPVSAGTEGDPVNLAKKRTTTYYNRKIGLVSTPTVKGASRIDKAFEEGDQQFFNVPCPHCGTLQPLIFGGLKWEKDDKRRPILSSVTYECRECRRLISEASKLSMLRSGVWIPTATGSEGVRSFALNELYSPWSRWSTIVENFYKAKDDVETLRVFINTTLGESWDDTESLELSEDELGSRVEDYELIPSGCLLLTAGVDVQDTWVEAVVWGWGPGGESWVVDHTRIIGSPANADTWESLDKFLSKDYEHEQGGRVNIVATGVDTGGHFTTQVYEYCKKREHHRVFAMKGFAGQGVPVVGKFSVRGRQKVKLFNVGVDSAKETIYNRLKNDEPGQGYTHFRKSIADIEFIRQLTAEKQTKRFVRGYPKLVWVQIRTRNEVLDCTVYAYAAMRILNPNFDALAANFERVVSRVEKPEPAKQDQTPKAEEQEARKKRITRLPRGGGWMNSY